ncbi:hypothetical protein D3M78_06635 [Rodentibacter pneumotropicus]|uniref:Uncharacterized protein n=2 Tax=Pasteurellaceae TaxID=712 RepID=A0A4S2PY60_9PAST|nr:hypothetical protein BKG97_09235 [Rodentibacter heylii]THA08990.1 hypothetical protein D3M78_06635 [Rodentibacter pneumotropicus]
MSKARNGEEALHEIGLSKYAVQRAFNHLSYEQHEKLKALADIEPFEDYVSHDRTGYKLEHYNEKGIAKIAKEMQEMSSIRAPFPTCLTRRDFFDIDPYTRGQP